ncbi:MAG: hypothetical protein M3510_01240 [Actinomycetota bacterium]|jgi:hypothetical protein|nr:hypothetical protein [Actinomycetota bacterium]
MLVRSHASGHARLVGGVVFVAGLWGALIPFVGPSFGYGMGSAPAWDWSESHLTLHLLPGIAAVLGGTLLMLGRRASQLLGSVLAVAGGAWFVIAPTLHPLWADPGMGGMSMGESALSSALSGLGYHYGTGALITIAAAYALGALGSAREVPSGVGSQDRQTSRDASPVRVDA